TLFSALVVGLSGSDVLAATLSGTVAATDGRPIAGAMVTAFNEPGDRKETVFTAADGRYALRTSFAGKLALRARVPYFADATQAVAVADDAAASVDFAMRKLSTSEELSDSLPASAHAALLDFPDRSIKEAFVSLVQLLPSAGQRADAPAARSRSVEADRPPHGGLWRDGDLRPGPGDRSDGGERVQWK